MLYTAYCISFSEEKKTNKWVQYKLISFFLQTFFLFPSKFGAILNFLMASFDLLHILQFNNFSEHCHILYEIILMEKHFYQLIFESNFILCPPRHLRQPNANAIFVQLLVKNYKNWTKENQTWNGGLMCCSRFFRLQKAFDGGNVSIRPLHIQLCRFQCTFHTYFWL